MEDIINEFLAIKVVLLLQNQQLFLSNVFLTILLKHPNNLNRINIEELQSKISSYFNESYIM